MEIKYKNTKVFLDSVSQPMHTSLALLLLYFFRKHYELVVTSAFRKGDPGVHGCSPLRGCDLRSYIYPYPEDMVKDANKDWVYDPKRPKLKCFVYHNVKDPKTGKKRGAHFHVQCSDSTKYIGG